MNQKAINTLVNQTISEIGEIDVDQRTSLGKLDYLSLEVIFYSESGNSFGRYYKREHDSIIEVFEFREDLPFHNELVNFLNEEDLKNYYNTLFEFLKSKLESLLGFNIGELPVEILSDNGFYRRVGYQS